MTLDNKLTNNTESILINSAQLNILIEETIERRNNYVVLDTKYHNNDAQKLKSEITNYIQIEENISKNLADYSIYRNECVTKLKTIIEQLEELEHITEILNLADKHPVTNGLISHKTQKEIIRTLNDYTRNFNNLITKCSNTKVAQDIIKDNEYSLNHSMAKLIESRDIKENYDWLVQINNDILTTEKSKGFLYYDKMSYTKKLLDHIKDEDKEIEYQISLQSHFDTKRIINSMRRKLIVEYNVLDPKPEQIAQPEIKAATEPVKETKSNTEKLITNIKKYFSRSNNNA